jgi:hypothetical protein
MAQKPLLVAIDFGALVERELEANRGDRAPSKTRKHGPQSGESASLSAPADPLRELESLGPAYRVRIYRTTMMCGSPLTAGADSDD